MKIISYYSDIDGSCYYSNHYKRFMKDADALGIDCHIKELAGGLTYQENCLRKPETIKSILQDVKEPVLWVDIDSKIHRNAFLPFHQLPPSVIFSAVAPAPHWQAIKASPLYFNYSSSCFRFLDEWIRRCKEAKENNKNVFDHEVLFTMQPWLNKHKITHNVIVDSHYCAWPGTATEHTIIEMGLSDNEQKRNILQTMNISEDKINWQCRGDTFE